MEKYLLGKSSKTHIQFLRYLVVGGAATVVDMGTLFSLTHFFHIHYLISASIAFCFGLVTNYLLSIIWVFESTGKVRQEFILFAIIGIGGLGLNELIMWIIVEKISLHYMIAKAISVMIVLFWNFFMRKKFCFDKKAIIQPQI